MLSFAETTLGSWLEWRPGVTDLARRIQWDSSRGGLRIREASCMTPPLTNPVPHHQVREDGVNFVLELNNFSLIAESLPKMLTWTLYFQIGVFYMWSSSPSSSWSPSAPSSGVSFVWFGAIDACGRGNVIVISYWRSLMIKILWAWSLKVRMITCLASLMMSCPVLANWSSYARRFHKRRRVWRPFWLNERDFLISTCR